MRLDALIKAEIDCYKRECNFRPDEMAVFDRRTAGETVEEIAEHEIMSVSTVKRILKRIQRKMERYEKQEMG